MLRRSLKPLRKLALYIVLVYCGLIAFLFFKQRDFIYFPDPNLPSLEAIGISDLFEDVEVTTKDGLNLHAWFIPPSEDGKPVLLLFHGNAGNISHRLTKIMPFTQKGYGVLLAEYRGYGGNPGAPDEQGLYHDGRAYYAWLKDKGYSDKDIIIYGESLGTGVSVQIASEYPAKALVLETPYARLSDPARRVYFFIPFIDALMHDDYSSIEKIDALNMPKLFLIAQYDEVLGAQTGVDLYDAAANPKTLIMLEGAGHNNTYSFKAYQHILDFLDSLPPS